MQCVIPECTNETWKGKMVGNLCAPCHSFLTHEMLDLQERNDKSQASTNRLEEIKTYLMHAELFQVREKWKKGSGDKN